jgi:hypothetical protein
MGLGALQASMALKSVGDIFMLNLSGDSVIRELCEAEWEEALKMPVDELLARPFMFLQTILDHTHSSYSHDLLVAARMREASEALGRPAAHLNGRPAAERLTM